MEMFNKANEGKLGDSVQNVFFLIREQGMCTVFMGLLFYIFIKVQNRKVLFCRRELIL